MPPGFVRPGSAIFRKPLSNWFQPDPEVHLEPFRLLQYPKNEYPISKLLRNPAHCFYSTLRIAVKIDQQNDNTKRVPLHCPNEVVLELLKHLKPPAGIPLNLEPT